MHIMPKKLTDLEPYARNSRTHSPEQVAQLVASIKEFGWTNPVLIDEHGGVIAGHGRIMAARELGMEEVPCIVLAGLTEAQKKAYIIADNKLGLNAGWDEEMLRLEMEDLQGLDFRLELTGFANLVDDMSLRREVAMEPLPGVKEEDLRPFSRTFFLIEVHPSDIGMVQAELDALRAKGVKIEQSSN
jgi:ParB-like chromosome segregation protein Spo0J